MSPDDLARLFPTAAIVVDAEGRAFVGRREAPEVPFDVRRDLEERVRAAKTWRSEA